jgi:hypothetical protein
MAEPPVPYLKVTVPTASWETNMKAPDLTTLKDFFRFHTATSNGKTVERPTSNSLNTFIE